MNDVAPHFVKTLANCPLFENIPRRKVFEALGYLDATIESHHKGDVIIARNQEVLRAGVILRGKAKASYFDEKNMAPIAIDLIHQGDVFGFGSVLPEGSLSHVQLKASTAKTVVCRLDLSPVLHTVKRPSWEYHHTLAANVIRCTSHYISWLHLRLRIISQKSVRQRLRIYLGHLADVQGANQVELPLSMVDLASFLNSDRSALYKEIRLLKEEGALEWDRRDVTLLNRNF